MEKQGTALNLPCTVGDILYGITPNGLKEYKVYAININMREHGNSCVIFAHNDRNATLNFELIDFGKTVFTIKEEAENKLHC